MHSTEPSSKFETKFGTFLLSLSLLEEKKRTCNSCLLAIILKLDVYLHWTIERKMGPVIGLKKDALEPDLGAQSSSRKPSSSQEPLEPLTHQCPLRS